MYTKSLKVHFDLIGVILIGVISRSTVIVSSLSLTAAVLAQIFVFTIQKQSTYLYRCGDYLLVSNKPYLTIVYFAKEDH